MLLLAAPLNVVDGVAQVVGVVEAFLGAPELLPCVDEGNALRRHQDERAEGGHGFAISLAEIALAPAGGALQAIEEGVIVVGLDVVD